MPRTSQGEAEKVIQCQKMRVGADPFRKGLPRFADGGVAAARGDFWEKRKKRGGGGDGWGHGKRGRGLGVHDPE